MITVKTLLFNYSKTSQFYKLSRDFTVNYYFDVNSKIILFNSYNEPEKLVQKEASKAELKEVKESKFGLLQSYLSTMKSGTKVFQHFLNNSNLAQILEGKVFARN